MSKRCSRYTLPRPASDSCPDAPPRRQSPRRLLSATPSLGLPLLSIGGFCRLLLLDGLQQKSISARAAQASDGQAPSAGGEKQDRGDCSDVALSGGWKWGAGEGGVLRRGGSAVDRIDADWLAGDTEGLRTSVGLFLKHCSRAPGSHGIVVSGIQTFLRTRLRNRTSLSTFLMSLYKVIFWQPVTRETEFTQSFSLAQS